MNSYMGSVYQQAISGVANLNNTWYDGRAYQSYAFEYTGPLYEVRCYRRSMAIQVSS